MTEVLVYSKKCNDCGKVVKFSYPLDPESKEPVYCRTCWGKRSPNIPNMKIVQRGHPHRIYGVKDETWPWHQSPYDIKSHKTFGRGKAS